MLTAELKDWMILMVIVSLMVQLTLKLIENVVLNKIMASISACWRRCCRRRSEDRNIRLDLVIKRDQDATVLHLMECGAVKKMVSSNKKPLRICTECDRYLTREQNRIYEVRREEEQ